MARLKHAYEYDRSELGDYELRDVGYDVEESYGTIEESFKEIEGYVKEMQDVLNGISLDNADTKMLNKIDLIVQGSAYNTDYIMGYARQAKDAGIENEDMLCTGRDYILQLENTLSKLEEKLGGSNPDLQTEIDQVQQTADEVEKDISAMLRPTRLRNIKLAGNYPYICAVHDELYAIGGDIRDSFSNILRYFQQIEDEAYNYDDESEFQEAIDDYKDDIQDELDYVNDAVERGRKAMTEGTDMNNRMVNGINNKVTRIDELLKQIDDLRGYVEQLPDAQEEAQELAEEEENIREYFKPKGA